MPHRGSILPVYHKFSSLSIRIYRVTQGDLFLLTESVKVLSEARWSVLRGGRDPPGAGRTEPGGQATPQGACAGL